MAICGNRAKVRRHRTSAAETNRRI
ncbi:hypothetical protein [Mycobacterium kiyosense]